jgi:hypothetical protein
VLPHSLTCPLKIDSSLQRILLFCFSPPDNSHEKSPEDSHEVTERYRDQVGLLLRWLLRLLRRLWLWLLWLWLWLWRLWLLRLLGLLGLLPGGDVA